MNVLIFPERKRPKATDISPWYGVYSYYLNPAYLKLIVGRPIHPFDKIVS